MTDVLDPRAGEFEGAEVQTGPYEHAIARMDAFFDASDLGQLRPGQTIELGQFGAETLAEDEEFLALFGVTHEELDPILSDKNMRLDRVTRMHLDGASEGLVGIVQRSLVDLRGPELEASDAESGVPDVFITYSVLVVEQGEVRYAQTMRARATAGAAATAFLASPELAPHPVPATSFAEAPQLESDAPQQSV